MYTLCGDLWSIWKWCSSSLSRALVALKARGNQDLFTVSRHDTAAVLLLFVMVLTRSEKY